MQFSTIAIFAYVNLLRVIDHKVKNELIKYRTNPVKHHESYGGVAHNVAKVIAMKEKVSLASINSDIETINYLKKKQNWIF